MIPEEEEYLLTELSLAHNAEKARIEATCDYLYNEWNTAPHHILSDPMAITQSSFKIIFRLLLDKTQATIAYRDTLRHAAQIIETQEGIEMRNDMVAVAIKEIEHELNVYKDVLERLLWSTGQADGTVLARGIEILERLKAIMQDQKRDAELREKFRDMSAIYGVEL